MTASVSAQQVDSKLPWSVRLTESEMIRYPESWQLDFQPKLKWDYCHGLELGAMLDVYDAYGDKKIRDYAIAYADTMVHEDVLTVSTTEKSFSVSMSRPRILNIRKHSTCFIASLKDNRVMRTVVFGIKRFIPTKCGWTEFTWELLSTRNMHSVIIFRRTMQM